MSEMYYLFWSPMIFENKITNPIIINIAGKMIFHIMSIGMYMCSNSTHRAIIPILAIIIPAPFFCCVIKKPPTTIRRVLHENMMSKAREDITSKLYNIQIMPVRINIMPKNRFLELRGSFFLTSL